MWFFIIIACAFLFNSQPADAVKCLQCVDMPHPFDCNIVTECSSSELCFVEQFITSGGLTLYNSGCLSKQRCTAKKRELGHRVAKRQDDQVSKQDLVMCIECCQGEYCNMEGCRQKALSRSNRGPKCFSCPAQLSPEDCRDTLDCDLDDVCALYKPHPYYNEWTSKCMGKIQCNALVQSQSIFIGKRNVFNVKQCPRCCTDDFCNDSCQHNVTSSVTSTTTAKPSTQPPLQTSTSKLSGQTTGHSTTGQTTPKPATHLASKVTTTKTHTGKVTTPSSATHGHPKTTTTKTHTGKVTTTTKPHSGYNTTTKAHGGQTTTKTHVGQTTTKTHGGQTTTTKKHVGHNTATPPSKHQTTSTKPHSSHKTTTSKVHQQTTTKAHGGHKTTAPKVHQQTTTKTHSSHKPTPPSTTPHLITTPDPSIQCKAEGYDYEGSTRLCLKFVTQKLNWTDAQEFCRKNNGRLVVMTSKGKIHDVTDYLAKHSQYHGTKYWVGATEVSHVHTFQWTNGKTIVVDDYSKYDLTKTNCLLTGDPKPSKEFNHCRTLNSFICENSDYIRA